MRSAGRPRNDRERIDRARAAAEALFRPGPQAPPADSRPSAEPAQRKPRVLNSAPPRPAAPAQGEAAAPPGIPKSQLARIRVWVEYGMTIPEVAQITGVSVGEIERILRDA
jgi:hypothetical protein